MTRVFTIFASILLAAAGCWAQADPSTSTKDKKTVPAASQEPFRGSPAYSELLLLRTELASGLEALILEYTEEYPKVKEMRHTLLLVERDSARLAKVKAADVSRLTLALGRLLVRKIELETELWKLRTNYKDEHPDVQRAKRRVEIYETAIGEILN
jgi:hypothetical protein